MVKIMRVYSKLSKHFSQLNWWPVTPKGSIHPKYNNGPKNEKQRLEVCFGAILTQNTNWKNAEKAIVNLNKNNLFDVNKIIKIDKRRLAKIIKSSGYHNQKAKKLKSFCNFLKKYHDGSLKSLFCKDVQELRNKLLSVNGIGPETADSIILYSAKKPIFVIDAYTKRIFSRIGHKEKTYEELQSLFMSNLSNNESLFNEYHALIVELGKQFCAKKPKCNGCPINSLCRKHGI